MKTFVRWVGILLVIVLLPFIAVPPLLYTPYVQGIATRWTAAWLTEQTKTEIDVESVHLKFPFRLEMKGLEVGDILNIEHFSTNIRLRPLLKGYLESDHVIIRALSFRTEPHLSLSVQGLKVEEISYRWFKREAYIRHILLNGGDIALHEYTPPQSQDTLSHKFPLQLTITDVQLLHFTASYGSAQMALSGIANDISLHHIAVDTTMQISFRSADLGIGSINLEQKGKSPWLLTQLNAHADSLCYTPQHITGQLTQLSFCTPYGIDLQEGAIDFTFEDGAIVLPNFTFRTAHSSLSGHLRTMNYNADSSIIDGDVNIHVGYDDALRLAQSIGNISNEFINLYPTQNLDISIVLKGSMEELNLTRCNISLPTAFDIKLHGSAQALTTPRNRMVQCHFEANTYDLEFLNTFISTSPIHIPLDMTCKGDLHYTYDTMYTQCLLSLDRGIATIEAGIAPVAKAYTLQLKTDSFDMRQVMPDGNVGTASLHTHITGQGTDFRNDNTTLHGTLQLHTLQWSGHTFNRISTQIAIADKHLHVHASCNDSSMQWTMNTSVRYTPDILRAQFYAKINHLDMKALHLTPTDIRPSLQCQATLAIDSGVAYALHAQFADIILTTPTQHIQPQPLTLQATLTPDTALLGIHSGDLTLKASAHTDGLPWQWQGITTALSALTHLQATLTAGNDNPISNYLTLIGIETDSIGLNAHYTDNALYAHLQSGLLKWHTPEMTLQGRASCSLIWSDNFAPNSLSGLLHLSSVRYTLPAYNLQLHTMNTLSIPFERGGLTFTALPLYTTDKHPLLLNGRVTLFGNTPSIHLRLTTSGTNLLYPQMTRATMLYGKAIISSDIMLYGPFNSLSITGDLRLLPGSSIHYIYKDAILTSSNQLDRVVNFVNFDIDDATLPKKKPTTSNLSMNLNISIDPMVQLEVSLGASKQNNTTIQGGGALTLQYIPVTGVRLAGRYTIEQGELNMNVPLLHVSHMVIRTGSTITWEGNPLNPLLNISAEDRIRASVTLDGSPQSVLFVAGVSLSDTMEKLNVQFTLTAPENASMQNTLATLSPEERGKLSVALLTTGLYLGEGGTGNLMNTALMGILQAQIDNISRDAFRTVDVSVGIEPLPDGVSGVSTRTDYSFSIAKRLWNNRVRFIIGGSVTTSNERIEDDTVIDNISIEWRITPVGYQYLRFFYDKNFESILEGEIRETGVGYAYRRRF